MRRLCAFVGLRYRPQLCGHVVPRQTHGAQPLQVDRRAAQLAAELYERLRAEAGRRPVEPVGEAT